MGSLSALVGEVLRLGDAVRGQGDADRGEVRVEGAR